MTVGPLPVAFYSQPPTKPAIHGRHVTAKTCFRRSLGGRRSCPRSCKDAVLVPSGTACLWTLTRFGMVAPARLQARASEVDPPRGGRGEPCFLDLVGNEGQPLRPSVCSERRTCFFWPVWTTAHLAPDHAARVNEPTPRPPGPLPTVCSASCVCVSLSLALSLSLSLSLSLASPSS